MKKLMLTTSFLWSLLLLFTPAFGNHRTSQNISTIFQKLVKDKITHIQLEADFDYLFENKKENKEQKATLNIIQKDNTILPLKIKIRPRGVYRRKICDIPPLRLNFDDEELAKMGLDSTFDKLKLVTHCVENSDAEQVLLREYWTYKLYNKVTPNSFRVHLIHITYVNSKNKTEKSERLGFLIENNKEMATRVGGTLVDKYGLTPSQITAKSLEDTRLFNYMIGNLDWHLTRNRNIKLVQLSEKPGIIVVPYDFDMSALVFPSYARLNPDYNQKRFTDRYCVGRFQSKEELAATIQKFQGLKTACLTNFEDCPYLTQTSKGKMAAYIKGFYKIINKKKNWKRQFL